ncbi:hypothetical protein FB451DRAFT_1165887 [Mycena latifolia]|nr:hypothetical protein FB451DRAFT_1165887 [Mycena latifolia]
MCDNATLRSSILVRALSLLPVPTIRFPYIGLGLICVQLVASLMFYAARQSPSKKLGGPEETIQVTKDILRRAKLDSNRQSVAAIVGEYMPLAACGIIAIQDQVPCVSDASRVLEDIFSKLEGSLPGHCNL